MRILHLYKDYFPVLGGIENHIKTLAEAQAAAGHQVSVLVTNPGREPARGRINGVEVIRTRRLATVASTPLTFGFPRALAAAGADVVHLHFPYPVGEVSQMLSGRGPYVVTYHSDVVRQQAILRLYRPLLWRFLRGAARVIATSSQYIASSRYLGPLAGKCAVVPLAVDPELFLKADPLIPPAGLPSLLFVGRHRYYKGVDDLIRALPGLEARLLVAGDGPMRPLWQALAQEKGVAGRVHFLGDVGDADLPRLYASADVFVLPANSRAEAFGQVLLEAMAAGLPCVTTELSTGTSYVVQDGVTGFVVPPRNPAELARATGHLLDDAQLRRAMGQAGQARVLREFTIEKLVSRIEAIYQDVLNVC